MELHEIEKRFRSIAETERMLSGEHAASGVRDNLCADLAAHVAAQQERLEGLEDMQGRILRTIPLPGEVVLDAEARREAAQMFLACWTRYLAQPNHENWERLAKAFAWVQGVYEEFRASKVREQT